MIYQILIRLFAPLVLILLAVDAIKRKGGWLFIKQRCGFCYPSQKQHYQYWLHCASVGEVNAALPLLKTLVDKKVIVTTNTPTGKQFLHKHLPEIEHAYCPFDWPYAIKFFLKAYSPQNLWVLETEIWPNLYQLCYTQNVTIQIINGRLSQKTLNVPNWLKSEYQKSLKLVDHVYAKSLVDKERFIKLGLTAKKAVTLGNIKFAQVVDLPSYPAPISQPYSLLASSHEDEETEISRVWQMINAQHNTSRKLVIAPRHPKRCQDLAKELNQLGLSVTTLSQASTMAHTDIILIDEIGRLWPFYEHADVVIMGGSFVNKGGHNLLEPCAYGKAVLTGPNMQNFAEETNLLLQNQAIQQCQDFTELTTQLKALLDNPEHRQSLGEKAKSVMLKQSKVLEKYQKRLNIDL